MRIFTSLVCLSALLVSSLTASAATTYVTQDGVRYKLNKDKTEATVVSAGTGKTYTGDIVIPSTITYSNQQLPVVAVGSSAFSECDMLTSVVLPESVTSIGDYAFDTCEKLTKVEMPAVKTIGHWSFRYCTVLENIIFPEGLTSIGNYAFDHNLKLTVIDLPSTVTNLGGFVFEGNPQITKMICRATTPPAIKKGYLDSDEIYTIFEDTDYGDIELVVPESSISEYKSALGWHYFTKVTPLSAGVDNIVADEDESTAVYYDIFGRKVENPQKGNFYIKQTSTKTSKIIF